MRTRNSRRKSTRPMVIVAVVVVVNASGEYIVWANLRRQRAIDETRRRTVREGEKQRKRETDSKRERGGGGRVSIVRERSRVNRLQSIRGSSWSRNGRRGVTSSGRNSENIQLACTRVCTYEEHVNVNTKRSTVCELIHVRVHVCVCTT